MTGSGSQRLSARHDPLSAMHGAAATCEGDVVGVRLGVDGSGVEGHCGYALDSRLGDDRQGKMPREPGTRL